MVSGSTGLDLCDGVDAEGDHYLTYKCMFQKERKEGISMLVVLISLWLGYLGIWLDLWTDRVTWISGTRMRLDSWFEDQRRNAKGHWISSWLAARELKENRYTGISNWIKCM